MKYLHIRIMELLQEKKISKTKICKEGVGTHYIREPKIIKVLLKSRKRFKVNQVLCDIRLSRIFLL